MTKKEPREKKVKEKQSDECISLKKSLDTVKKSRDILLDSLNSNIDEIQKTISSLKSNRNYLVELGISPKDVSKRVEDFNDLVNKMVNESKYNIIAIKFNSKKKIDLIEQEMKDKKCEAL